VREKLINFGAKIVHHARYVTLQMAEEAIPRTLFREILRWITRQKTWRPFSSSGRRGVRCTISVDEPDAVRGGYVLVGFEGRHRRPEVH
jgi:hypothetical protein